ncbi:ribosome silencing factor [Algoriphagus jejuensis]|uniref:Ribosomal silencing factor RsfS n=1 Tax=Algoriphagus jejuensis TaxID=419934 RepID=A0ABP3YFE7_9BACT
MTAEALSKVIVRGMEEKKASKIQVLDLRKIKDAVTDFFVICSGNSDTQLEAISKSIEEEVQKVGEGGAWRVEGKTNGEWVLMDYVNVVVHIFIQDKREFYGLEDLWGDAQTTLVN